MQHDKLQELQEKLEKLYEQGDEAGAQTLIGEEFPKLPEEVQGELLARMYFKTLGDQNRQAEILAQVQEKALDALDALDVTEEALKKKADS